MRHLRAWFCRQRRQLLRWSLMLVAITPLLAWSASKAFAVDASSVVVVIAFALFAVWRPYRDSWLQQICNGRTPLCVLR